MVRNLYAGGGVQAFQGQNNPLYVQNQNELKSAFAALQNDIANAGTPIGAVVMWVGTTANIPSGFAVCNGASLSTTTYGTLFNIIQYRYGGAGANFSLPDFSGRVPEGIVGAPTVPGTVTTNAASAVDAHTHSVNSSFTAGSVNSSFTAGNAASHVHSNSFSAGSVNSSFTAGNANNHTHGVSGNTADANVAHSHGYFKPNSGANNNTTSQNPIHSHGVSITSSGSNTTIGVNSSFTAGNTNSSFTSGGVNTAIGVNSSFTAGNVNSSFTAGNASTINASTPAHTHTLASLEIIFIIRVA